MNIYIAWIVVAVVVVGGIVLSSMSGGELSYGGKSMMTNIDRHFIEQMIPHHEGAIEMAQLALQKSKRPEILSLSNAIIEAQTKEIVDMRAWYLAWFGTDVLVDDGKGMGMMHGEGMQMQGMEGDLNALTAAADFDKEFLKQMIVHHEMAIMMGNMLASGTERNEMKSLADNIITSQSKEIEMMRSWLAAW